jgi:hypothetical protein
MEDFRRRSAKINGGTEQKVILSTKRFERYIGKFEKTSKLCTKQKSMNDFLNLTQHQKHPPLASQRNFRTQFIFKI